MGSTCSYKGHLHVHHSLITKTKFEEGVVIPIFSFVQFSRSWIAACQASLSVTNSRSLLKLMSIESVMPPSHLILCHPLLLLPAIPPRIRVFSNESTLRMRWPKYWSFSFSCSIFSFNCCFLTCIQVSQEAGQVVWYSHLFQNFPQFIVIHTVKGFGTVNKAEIDVFLELSYYFDDPAYIGNLISDSSAFTFFFFN